MKVIVCGDRNWTDFDTIYNRLKILPKDTIIVHGGCRGADALAEEACHSLALRSMEFPAHWHLYGRAAGPIRNKCMLTEKPDLVIAFHSNIEESKGTANMIGLAGKANINIELIK